MTTQGRRIAFAPPEGWLTVGLVVVLCLSLAWSLDDAMLVLGRDTYTDFLVWTALGGAIAGFMGPVVRWGRWTTFVIGAVLAALVTPLLVGAVVVRGADVSLHQLFIATADATAGAYEDLIVRGRQTTPQFGHHLLVIGLLVWGSSMFASFSVFGHRRPLNAVFLLGLLLVANMSLTTRDQLVYLVLFTLAALFLLIRLHTLEEQGEWLRRRIGDPSAIASLYLRGGTVFITAAVVGSLVLTSVAASAPLAGAWTDVGGRVIDWSRSISRFLPQSGTGVSLGPSFGSSATITGSWISNDGIALTVEIPNPRSLYKPYWRAVTHDVLTLDSTGYDENAVEAKRPAGQPLLDRTGDAVSLDGRQEVTFRITPAGGNTIYAPQTPISVDVPTTLRLVGTAGYFAAIERDGGSGAYTVTSYTPITGDSVAGALTKNKLRTAGTAYPEEIAARYAQKPDVGILGPKSREVLADIRQGAATNAYDLATDIERYLKDSENFQYDRDITDRVERCGSLSRIECFAEVRRGFCQYYAAMMTAFLREEGVPARLAYGFLPGDRNVETGIETIRNDLQHAWVEVYFPGYGWVDFDPTGGGVAQLAPIPEGRAQASASPGPSASASRGARPSERDPRDIDEPGGAGGTANPRGSAGPLIAVALLLAVIVAALAAIVWRRGPRGPVSADGAYGMVTGLAGRFGFGPRPNQTVYEYAGTLGEVLPGIRPELEMVAQAKVEVTYGGRLLGDDRLMGLREAQRRLRVRLLRLGLRRFRRGRRPGPGGRGR